MTAYSFQEVNIPPSMAREREIEPITPDDIIWQRHMTPSFGHQVRAFTRTHLPNPELCTVSWREKGQPSRRMLVSRAGGEPMEEFGLIHISPEETPLDILNPATREIVARIISKPTVDSTTIPLESV